MRGQGAAADQHLGRGEVVQDHVHPHQAGDGHVLLVPFQRHVLAGFGGQLQQQRARAAASVVGSGFGFGVVRADADTLPMTRLTSYGV